MHQLGIYSSDYTTDRKYLGLRRPFEDENSEWIDLLRTFIAVKDLTLGERVILSVASALQENCWGTSNRNFTSAAKHFSREFRVAGFSSERDCEVHYCARALWSPCDCAPPGSEAAAVRNTSEGWSLIDGVRFSSD